MPVRGTEKAIAAMEELHGRGDFFGVVESVSEDTEHMVIVMRYTDGQLYFVDLSVAKPRFSRPCRPHANGLQWMAGSGWKLFHAYMSEHDDHELAFYLTSKLHRDVARPMESF